jgi:hypothetical protein
VHKKPVERLTQAFDGLQMNRRAQTVLGGDPVTFGSLGNLRRQFLNLLSVAAQA